MSRAGNESGMALVTVIVVLASMALLISGVYTLVTEGSRSANYQIRFDTARAAGETGLGQVASLIDRISNPNFNPPAPEGYGVQWASRENFGDYLRGDNAVGGGSLRASDADAPTETECVNGEKTDIEFTANTEEGPVDVKACVIVRHEGGLSGSGQGQVFARTSPGTADRETLLEVTIWAQGSQDAVNSQFRSSVRAFH